MAVASDGGQASGKTQPLHLHLLHLHLLRLHLLRLRLCQAGSRSRTGGERASGRFGLRGGDGFRRRREGEGWGYRDGCRMIPFHDFFSDGPQGMVAGRIPEGDQVSPGRRILQLAGIGQQAAPMVPDAVADDRVPFADEDLISLALQERRHIVEGISQRLGFAIFEFAQYHPRLDLIPWQALEHRQVVAFGVDLQKVDPEKVVFLHDVAKAGHRHCRGLPVGVVKGFQAADAGALVGSEEWPRFGRFVGERPRIDGHHGVRAEIVLQAAAIGGIRLEGKDFPAPLKEAVGGPAMMRSDIDHDGRYRSSSKKPRNQLRLVDMGMFASPVWACQSVFDVLEVAKRECVQPGMAVGVQDRDARAFEPAARHPPRVQMQIGEAIGVRDMIAIALALIIVEEVIWGCRRAVRYLQDVPFHHPGAANMLDVIAVYAQKVDRSVSKHGSHQGGMAASGNQLPRQKGEAFLHVVEDQDAGMVREILQAIDEVAAQHEISNAVGIGFANQAGNGLLVRQADNGIEANVIARGPADPLPMAVGGVHAHGVEALEAAKIESPQGRAIAKDDEGVARAAIEVQTVVIDVGAAVVVAHSRSVHALKKVASRLDAAAMPTDFGSPRRAVIGTAEMPSRVQFHTMPGG